MVKLDEVLAVLRTVAPEHLAEEWDQVGIHLSGDGKAVKKALLCIDLTPAVLEEAIQLKCQLIVAYHPPIFQAIKRLADRDWKERMLARAIRHGIAVYSPHTALDAVRPGMNDWLCDGLGESSLRRSIASPKRVSRSHYKIVVFVPRKSAERVRRAMFDAGGGTIGNYFDCSFNLDGIGTFHGGEGTHPAIGKPGQLEAVEETRIELICSSNKLADVLKAARRAHPYEEPAIDVFQLASEEPSKDLAEASGRVAVLKQPIPAKTLIARVKKALGVKQVKAALPSEHRNLDEAKNKLMQSIAVCVGAGGSLFEKCPDADAYITGEMQHHQVLDLYLKGKVVILAGHTNTERPFLRHYRDRLIAGMGEKIDWLISEADATPMSIV
jgi:dinuclear metal center YbgI/SA1388 family protein